MKTKRAPASSVGNHEHPLIDPAVDRAFVTIATWVAAAFFLILVAWWASTEDMSHLARSLTPAMVATTGAVMLSLDRPRAIVLLGVGVAGLFGLVGLAPAPPDSPVNPLIGLLTMVISGTVLVRRQVPIYVASAAVAIGIAALLWSPSEASVGTKLFTSLVAIAGYGFITWLLLWLKRRSATGHQALQDLVESKGEFVASVSHELRTPLTAIVGLAQELHQRFDDFSRQEIDEFVRLIVSESTDVANIVEDLLVAARAEIGTLALRPSRLDLRHELVLAMNDLGPVPIQGIDEKDVVRVYADGLRLRQIVRNLLVNATRYGGERVRMVVYATADDVYIEVRDNGQPIPLADRNTIFEPYQRSQRPGRPGAVGLGLTVSRGLARLMGGDLTYAHDGHEAVFALRLPMVGSQVDLSPAIL